MKRSHRSLYTTLALTALAAFPASGSAAILSVYDYMAAQASPFTSQTGTETWTFHYGDQDAAFMPPLGSNPYFGFDGPIFARFGGAADVGGSPSGTAGVNEAPGVFVQSANDRPVTAVYTFATAMSLDSLRLTYELVQNGTSGNGITATIRLIHGASVTDLSPVTITNTTSQTADFPLGSPLADFDPGDRIAVVFTPRGNYVFDHGWFNLSSVAAPIPEPSRAIYASALLAIALLHRRRTATRTR